MKKVRKLISGLLLVAMLLQFSPMFPRASATPTLGTPDPPLSFYPNTSGVPDGFNTADLAGPSFNGEGVWITEIYNNDIDRRVSADTRAANSYEPIHTYDFDINYVDLMEFIEVVSTHDEDIKLNDLYEFYCGSTKLNITTVSGSSDVTVHRGQPVVIWNYRSDLGIPLPTEAEFREDMRIPDNAMVLIITNSGDLGSNLEHCIKNKQTGETVCSFTTENNVNLQDGLGVELQLPMQGSTMEVYRSNTLPSAGYVYASQVRYMITAQPIEGFNSGKGVYISEIRPNDIDRSGTYGSDYDLMECIEVYNNTDAAIDLNKDYKLVYTTKESYRRILPLYQYGTSSNNYVGSSSGCTVPAGGTAVLWCFRRSLDTNWTSFPTLSQFRSAYGISSSTPVYLFTNQNSLTNTKRAIELFKANGNGLGQLVSTYTYNGSTDLSDNKSVHLKINPEGPEMLIHSANTASTMGKIDSAQMTYTVDYGDAVMVHLADGYSVPEYVMQGDALRVNFFYDFNGRTGRTATDCYYRLDGEGEWLKAPEGGIRIPNLFEVIIPAYYLWDHEYVEFYVYASNKIRETVLGIYKVPIRKLNDVDGIRTNISQGEEVRGTVSITANDGGTNSATKIYIDGQQYSTTKMFEDGAYFSFQTEGIGGSSMSQVTTTGNKTIAHIGDFLFAVPDDQLIRIDNSYFSYNSSTQKYTTTLRFWAGTNGIPSEDYLLPSGGRDDYEVTDIKLKLPNGKTYLPSSIGPSSYNGVDTSSNTNLSTAASAVHWIGDSSATCPYMDVTFSIPASDANAVGFSLNTENLSNGTHTLKVTNGTYTETVTFIVDNTAPAVNFGIADGANLTKDITIDPQITEANTVAQLKVVLDGEEIETPYATTAYALGEGSHTLQVNVADLAGNTTTKKITFNVTDISMTLTDAGTINVTGSNASLYLTAQSSSATNVTFYRAERVDAARIQSETVDGLVPYLSYMLTVGDVSDSDDIVINWNGTASNADNAHACNLFVRNVNNGRWEPVAKADGNGSINNAAIPVMNHVKDGKMEVIIQCTEGSSMPDTDTVNDGIKGNNSSWDGNSRPNDYDFSFAWISDTQGYVQRTNYQQNHHMKMCQWIVDNREEWKISYVMHTGDLVDDPDAIYMWEHADQASKIFEDAEMPYGVLAGNHDIYAMLDIRDEYYNYFGENRYKNQWYYGGSYENNYGHYDLISQNGQDFIIVYMSYNVYEDEINWMNEVLAKYSDRKAILCFHDYTHVHESQEGNLSYYGVLIRNKVVAKNPNVFAVLSGHYGGASYQTARFDDNGDGSYDRTVYQICTDYQDLSAGGLQYIKFLYFDLDNDKVFVNSYSPYKNDFNYYDSSTAPDLHALAKAASNGKVNNGDVDIDSSILTVDFTPKKYTIQENSFSATVYTDEVLGTATLDSGRAQTETKALEAESEYSWYAVLENENTGVLRTDAYDFTTGHNYVAVVTPPTCTSQGFTTYTCTGCGDSYVGDWVAATHNYVGVVTPPTCSSNGFTTYTCSICGNAYIADPVEATGHRYEAVVTEPTCTEAGFTTYTCANCNHTYVSDPVSALNHNYVSGSCTRCGVKDPNAVEQPTLTLNYPSLSFEDEILYNVYYTIDDTSSVTEMGLLTYAYRNADGTVYNALDVIPGYVNSGSTYMVQSRGIPAKNLGDALYFKIYAKLTDGTYVYSDIAGYHAVAYANTVLNNASSATKAKALVVAMLNYGAAAQEYFGYKTDALMNASLTAAQQSLVADYDESMVDDVAKADTAKVGSFVMDGGYSNIFPTVSFEGAFSINFYFTPSKTVDSAPPLYYWDAETYNSVSVLSPWNATGVITMAQDGSNWGAAIEGIAAKQIDETVYVAGLYSSNGVSYPTGVISYSLGKYCETIAANGEAFGAATAVYGYYAKAYFA